MKRLATFVIILLGTATVHAKVILIHIHEALQAAKAIKTIVVIGYKDSMMLYRFADGTDTQRISCWAKPYSEPFRQTLIDRKMMAATGLAGKWPGAGEQVVMVVGMRNTVSLFATRSGDDYRFWDPNSIPFANSIFIIPPGADYKPLPGCADVLAGRAGAGGSCEDGCLVKAAALEACSHTANTTNALLLGAAGFVQCAALLQPILSLPVIASTL